MNTKLFINALKYTCFCKYYSRGFIKLITTLQYMASSLNRIE